MHCAHLWRPTDAAPNRTGPCLGTDSRFPHSGGERRHRPAAEPVALSRRKDLACSPCRAWLSAINPSPEVLVEPFAGGAIVSLTAVMEGLAERCVMSEIDPDVAAFWKAALWHSDELIERVHAFVPTRESIAFLNDNAPDGVVSRGFRTLVLNRTRRGGILANGASLARVGESGKRRGFPLVPGNHIAPHPGHRKAHRSH